MCGSQGATLSGTFSFSPVASNAAPRPSPKVSKRGPRLPQEGPTGHQNGSKIGPRELQEASKKDDSSPANRLWMGQDGPRTPQDDNRCVCEYVYVYAYVYVYVYVFAYLCLTIYCSNSPSTDNSPRHRLWMGWWGYAMRQQYRVFLGMRRQCKGTRRLRCRFS